MRIKALYLIIIISGVFIVATLGFVFIPIMLRNTQAPPDVPPPPPPPTSEIEVDDTGTVYYIVDGDTYDQSGLPDTDRVRLADIDSPESYEAGYQEAKDYLYSLIYGEFLYVDIDDVYGKGYYGRWICVVYVRIDSDTVMNVNYKMVLEGHAVIDNYDNEFNPYGWKLYYTHPS